MKQLLTVTGILVCAYLSGGFTTAIHPTAGAATGKGILKKNNKWKNSPWVNPWAGAKRFTGKQSALNTARVNWNHDCRNPSIVTAFDVEIGGVDYQGCSMPAGVEIKDTYDGAWVHLYIAMHWNAGSLTAYVEDHSDGELFFDDIRPYASFSFQVQAGHEYTVFTETYDF